MSEPVERRVEIQVGDVSRSQLVIGDHNTIQTPHGTKVTVLQVGEQPVPRLRALPLAYRPESPIEIVGREEELRYAAGAGTGEPRQLHGPTGAGKTVVMKVAAQGRAKGAEGSVFAPVRRRTLDEIQARLYTTFWETDVPFRPTAAEVGGFLVDREALLALDDCELDRDDLDVLLDSVPRCTVLISSSEQTLWSRGSSRVLEGLDPAAGTRLVERRLGRALAPGERQAAEALTARLDGHPQSLVEVAALVADGKASLDELANDAKALGRLTDASRLSASQRRIVELLAALGGASLGVPHISAVADAPNAADELDELESLGWTKSDSPRYRLVRPLPDGLASAAADERANRLLGHLAHWSAEARPAAVAEEAEALEATLDLGAAGAHWQQTLTLALAAEPKLGLAGSLTRWHNVLVAGLKAARTLGAESAEAHLLHQLGSLDLCLGAEQLALTRLEEALAIRERIGDRRGAELSRHNLGQIGGPGPGPGGDGGGRWRPPLGGALAALVALAVVIGAVVLATDGGGGGDTTASQPPTTTGQPASSTTSQPSSTTTAQPPPTTTNPAADTDPPTVAITAPADGATYTADSGVDASYVCADEEGGSGIDTCVGTVPNDNSIDLSEGDHKFTVTARDKAGNETRQTVTYSVLPPPDVVERGDTTGTAPTTTTTGPTSTGPG